MATTVQDRAGELLELVELMRQQIGLRVRVVPVAPGLLPRTDGKARRVVDERASRWSTA